MPIEGINYGKFPHLNIWNVTIVISLTAPHSYTRIVKAHIEGQCFSLVLLKSAHDTLPHSSSHM